MSTILPKSWQAREKIKSHYHHSYTYKSTSGVSTYRLRSENQKLWADRTACEDSKAYSGFRRYLVQESLARMPRNKWVTDFPFCACSLFSSLLNLFFQSQQMSFHSLSIFCCFLSFFFFFLFLCPSLFSFLLQSQFLALPNRNNQ